MIRFLPISLFIFCFLSACSLQTTEGLRSVPTVQKKVENIYFSDIEKDYVYKAKIDVYGNYFGGIVIIKKLAPQKYRVVFTTEFGNKLFDFLFEGEQFTKNFIVPDLDKKMVVTTLRNDFQMLLKEKNLAVQSFEDETFDVYKAKDDNRFAFYFFQKNTDHLTKIVQTSKHKEKVEIRFEGETKPENSVSIKHKNFKLSIQLDALN